MTIEAPPYGGLKPSSTGAYTLSQPDKWLPLDSEQEVQYVDLQGEWVVTIPSTNHTQPIYLRIADNAVFTLNADGNLQPLEDPNREGEAERGEREGEAVTEEREDPEEREGRGEPIDQRDVGEPPEGRQGSDEESDGDEHHALDLKRDIITGFATAAGQSERLMCRLQEIVPTDVFDQEGDFECTWTSFYQCSSSGRSGEFIADRLISSYLGTLRATYLRLKQQEDKERETKRPRIDNDTAAGQTQEAPSTSAAAAAAVLEKSAVFDSISANLVKGFKQVNHNYSQYSKKQNAVGEDVAQSTGIILCGPDPEGLLRLIAYNLGGCRAFVCGQSDVVEVTQSNQGRFGGDDGQLLVDTVMRPVDLENDNWILIGSTEVWKILTPSAASELVRVGLRRSFEEFLQEARHRCDGEDIEDWFTSETKKWLRNLNLTEILEHSIISKLRGEGGVALLVFGWRPLEALIGGEK